LLVLAGVVMIIISATFLSKDYILLYLASTIFIVSGIYMMVNGMGFPSASEWFTQSLALVIICLGVYINIMSSLDLMGDIY
jgi:hypothetical protein